MDMGINMSLHTHMPANVQYVLVKMAVFWVVVLCSLVEAEVLEVCVLLKSSTCENI
jgi:hypothetical protein